MKNDIFLIEGDDNRRVALLRSLAGASYRVTASSSLKEADEILQFVDCPEAAPDIVLVGSGVTGWAASRFEKALVRRFGEVSIVRVPQSCDPASLLQQLRVGTPRSRKSRPFRRWQAGVVASTKPRTLTAILIDSDRERRVAIEDHMRLRGDDVVGCGSIDEAAVAFDDLLAQGFGIDAVLSVPDALDGAGLKFCVSATKRLPDLRWIFIGERAPADMSLAS